MTSAEAIALIEAAAEPGDLFGHPAGSGAGGSAGRGAGSLAGRGAGSPAGRGADGDAAGNEASGEGDPARRYRRLARLTHPDVNPGDLRAASAFARLTELWGRHQGIGGPAFAKGDIANLYLVRPGVHKLVRDPADNDLIRREAAALTRIGVAVNPRLLAYFPRLVEAHRQQDPHTGVVRLANVLDRLDGFFTLVQVRAAFPDGVDPRDAAWMWRRLLAAIGAAHRAGVIHGAVLPEHVLIHPAEHGLVLVDWCYSSINAAGRLPAIVGRYRDWYPPEVLAGEAAGPDLDIWLAARCLTDLIGARLPRPMASFAAGCQLARPSTRPADAWRVLADFDEVLDRLYGPRTFRPFAMPA